MSDLVLSAAEIYEITHARWVRKQLQFFTEIGVPAHIRPDNTLHVRRADYLRTEPAPAQNTPAVEPQWAVNVVAIRGGK